jgi:hypothetical protein
MKKIQKLETHLQRDFKNNYGTYWNNLSRLTNMLIISNFSLFFLTELVTRDRYYYTHLSLGFLLIVHIILILPLGLLNRIWFYSLCLLLEFGSIYFFVVSIWYWVVTNISWHYAGHDPAVGVFYADTFECKIRKAFPNAPLT